MYIAFIDESGQPGGWNAENKELTAHSSKFFTLSGFMVDANDILNIEQKFKDIKAKYGLNESTEVKWNLSYSKIGLTFEQYRNMKLDIIEMISSYKNSIVGIVMDKESCYKNKPFIKTHNDLYAFALNLIMERIGMEISGRENSKTPLTPTIIFADSRKNNNNNILNTQLQISYLKAIKSGTHYIQFQNFSENLVFIDSNYSCEIQCADFCAGIIQRKFENHDDTFFNLLLPAIRSDKSNNIYGYGIKIYG